MTCSHLVSQNTQQNSNTDLTGFQISALTCLAILSFILVSINYLTDIFYYGHRKLNHPNN